MSNREWEDRAEGGDGQFAIAVALLAVAASIQRLGNADAATPFGAIEGLGAHLGEKLDALTAALTATGDE